MMWTTFPVSSGSRNSTDNDMALFQFLYIYTHTYTHTGDNYV